MDEGDSEPLSLRFRAKGYQSGDQPHPVDDVAAVKAMIEDFGRDVHERLCQLIRDGMGDWDDPELSLDYFQLALLEALAGGNCVEMAIFSCLIWNRHGNVVLPGVGFAVKRIRDLERYLLMARVQLAKINEPDVDLLCESISGMLNDTTWMPLLVSEPGSSDEHKKSDIDYRREKAEAGNGSTDSEEASGSSED